MFAGTLFFVYFCLYFPRSLLALPSPQQSASIVQFGPSLLDFENGDNSEHGIVTKFLVPSGTSSGGDQTTFEYVQVESVTVESLSGTETVMQTTLATFTNELVASASGFTFGATATFSEVLDGIPTITIVTDTEQCQATANNSGECVADVDGVTKTATGIANTQLIAVSGAPSNNGAFKRERYDQKLLVGLVFGTMTLGIFSGAFLAL
ncbi:hypothetical protein BT96DRAFT_981302 [Gymnopus androsaceus JB14]|uniref:Mid2 domain-containing protein n=1 Tax=Gymnopus androsaceus JB14 TaxID=1447944 RepID=A0A6A4GR67_9AGAR|nr:hypothetical protein BT96DRAFT_981302 [Gymnopus androsaceus JB14]